MVNRRGRTALLCGLVCTLAACTVSGPGPDDTSAADHGAAGIGDTYYPMAGNGGYDVAHYAVSVRYDPGTGRLSGDTTVTAHATEKLTRFNLDLRGFSVSSVHVNGESAEFTRRGEAELVITPASAVAAERDFAVRVRYAGEPIEAEAGELGRNGWYRTSSGGAFVLGEPVSASYWYPVNEHPRDKATFELTARVPRQWTAVSVGRKAGESTAKGWTTTRWRQQEPIASYLTVFAVDHFTVERGELEDGTPVRNIFAPGSGASQGVAGRVGEVVGFLEDRFGDYPASKAGGIYLGTSTGFALETQGTPTYPPQPNIELLVHELAHQWYGNSVTPHSWADICLSECFASYATWLWAEEQQGMNLDAHYERQLARLRDNEEFWAQKLYDMGAGNEFTGVYSKGPLAVHALRERIGDKAFAKLIRTWPARRADGTASWPEFEKFVAESTGKDLHAFFDAWFHSAGRPAAKHL